MFRALLCVFTFAVFIKNKYSALGPRCAAAADTGWWDGPLGITHLMDQQRAAARPALSSRR